ncbi:MAG TPA: di-heme oxidoredictase family protein [Gemmatimonadota bacterium]|nr:di-heme oxidoredictase family protein [Gemmatimonadota bacterium]
MKLSYEITRCRRHAWLLAVAALTGCGDLFTEAPRDADLFDAPLDGLSREEQAAFLEGDEQFGVQFRVADGLGPIFNDVSCAACHSGDGRGRPENALIRISRGTDPALDVGGPQIQDRAIPGAVPETVPSDVDASLRLPPPVFGVGLIEAIPVEDILANADPDDADGDGISGRPNMVTPPDFVPANEPGAGPGPQLGRFARKAQVSSLLQQVVDAYHQDIGITTDFRVDENLNPQASRATEVADRVPDPELGAPAVLATLDYLRMLAPPAPGEPTPRRERGEAVFGDIGCAACHVPEFTSGPSPIPGVSGRRVVLYSDLLLHDMGPGLADDRPDGDASGSEWRTAPLWGLRVMRDFLDGEAFLLHDGSASTVEEAIRLHGGEAEAARVAFEALPDDDREAVLDFVETR